MKIVQKVYGIVWWLGFLGTVGFCDLTFGQGVAAFFIWPVYVGRKLAGL